MEADKYGRGRVCAYYRHDTRWALRAIRGAIVDGVVTTRGFILVEIAQWEITTAGCRPRKSGTQGVIDLEWRAAPSSADGLPLACRRGGSVVCRVLMSWI